MELYIIRHGETEWNKQKRLQGRSDIKLNAYGVHLAEITSEALKEVEFDEIYSSPLSRAYETAVILKRNRDLIITEDDRLMEMGFGDYEGKPVDRLPEEFQYFFSEPEKYVPAPRGESYEELLARAQDFLEEEVFPKAQSTTRMMIVAHGALNKALMVTLNKQEIKDMWKGIFQRNCCVNIYKIEDKNATLLQDGTIYYEEEKGKRYK